MEQVLGQGKKSKNTLSVLLTLEFNLICIIICDGTPFCPTFTPEIIIIIIILNKWIWKLLKMLLFKLKAIQLLGKDAGRLIDIFTDLEDQCKTKSIHPAAIVRSQGLMDAFGSGELNAHHTRVLNSCMVSFINGNPLVAGGLLKPNLTEAVFKKIKEAFPRSDYPFPFAAESFAEMTSNACLPSEASYRLSQNDWGSDLNRANYNLEDAQSLQRSEPCQNFMRKLLGTNPNEWKMAASTVLLQNFYLIYKCSLSRRPKEVIKSCHWRFPLILIHAHMKWLLKTLKLHVSFEVL